MNETRTLASFLASLTFDQLPADVVRTAKLCILDTLGVGLAACQRPWSQMTTELVAETAGIKESTVWGQSALAPAQYAALANGTSAHGIELDDRVPIAQEHPGCVAVPVALALAEKLGSSGRDFITATVAGYELGVRVGLAVKVKYPGIHPSGHKAIWVAVGSACAGLGLDEQQTLDAYGIAGSMAGGVSEFSEDPRGTMIKRLHCGLASYNGIVAALLARKGFTGPATILEGPYGYCNVFAAPGSEPRMTELTDGLADPFRIMYREVKPYAAWGGGHLAIDAVADLQGANTLNPSEVRRITVRGSSRLIHGHSQYQPGSIMAAQYSLPFLLAVAVVRGAAALANPDETWTDQTLSDPVCAAVASKVSLQIDPELTSLSEAQRHYGGARLTIELADGRVLTSETRHSKGTLENPMSDTEVEQKFLALASTAGRSDAARGVIETVSKLDELESARDLGAAIRDAWAG